MDRDGVSLAISISGDAEQRHLGFVVTKGAETYLYHLAFHCRFFKNSHDEYVSRIGNYLRVSCEKFTRHEQLHIFRYLESIFARSMRCIPYGFNFVADSVLTKEGLVPEGLAPGSGLTCSTFVIQVFRNQDIEILDLESWQPRPDDQEWQRHIINVMRAHEVPEDHISALEACIGNAVRYRPEEVAGCAREFDEEPIVFNDGVVLGERVYEEMKEKGVLVEAG